MKFNRFVSLLGLLLVGGKAMPQVGTHEEGEEKQPPKGMNWEQWHMSHEHQSEKYDSETFFDLHDNGKKGYLDNLDILSMYGLSRNEIVGSGDGMGLHDDSEDVDKELGKRVVDLIMQLLDVNDDSKITKQEYLEFSKNGWSFPDLGVGVGHHSDFEKEYELHHWSKYHKDNDRDMKNIHKEDVEHYLLHHEHSIEHEDVLERGAGRGAAFTDDDLESRIVHSAIPKKYYTGVRNI